MPASKPTKDDALVRLQIPVSKELAAAVDSLAELTDRSQGYMACWLLEIALDEPKNFGKWIARRAMAKVSEAERTGWRQLGGTSDVRIQMKIRQSYAERLEAFASRLNHTLVRGAALLLDFAVDEYGWEFRTMHSPLVRSVTAFIGIKRPSRDEAEREWEKDVPDYPTDRIT